MAGFEIRSPTAHWGAWPAGIPEMHRVQAGARLLVPLAPAGDAGMAQIRDKGTRVAAGEALTVSASQSAHVPVAPWAGTVGAVCEAAVLGAGMVQAVEVLADDAAPAEGSDAAAPALAEPAADHLPELINLLRQAGVQAYRRASPDLVQQLLQALRRPVDTIVCNLLDSDPPLRLQAALGATAGGEIVEAVAALRRWTGARAGVVAVDAGTPAAWLAELRRAAREARVRVTGVRNDYPGGDPSLLMYHLLGRRLRPGRLPVEQAVVMLDGAAAMAVARALRTRAAMTHVPVAVFDHTAAGGRGQRVRLVEAPVGMSVGDLLGALAVPTAQATLRAGALLRDVAVEESAVLAGGELVLHVLPRAPLPVVHPCIRCGWCVEACPTRIHPAGLLEAAQHEDAALAERYGLEACIECGICSYVCPSDLPLLEGIRQLRAGPLRSAATA